MVEEYLIVKDVFHQWMARAELFVKHSIERIFDSARIPAPGRNSTVLHQAEIVGGCMVGSKEEKVVILTYRLVQRTEKVGKVTVKTEISIFCFDGISSELVSYVVG